MRNFNGFGQIMALFDLANQAQYNAANAMIRNKQVKGELKLSQQELEQQERLAKLDLSFKSKELLAKEQLSKRRDELFKDIALYASIGIGALILLIVIGVMFVGKKKESQFEYLVEED